MPLCLKNFILNPVLSTMFSFFLVYCFTREVTAGQISIEVIFFVDIKLLWPQNLSHNLDGLPNKDNKI